MALYDLKMNKKITEDFHFDSNEPHIRALINSMQSNADDQSEAIEEFPANWLAFPRQVCLRFNRCAKIISYFLLNYIFFSIGCLGC